MALVEKFEQKQPDDWAAFITLDLRFYNPKGESVEDVSLLLAPEAVAVIRAALDAPVTMGSKRLPYSLPTEPDAATEPEPEPINECHGF
jgi:hypothetical protein